MYQSAFHQNCSWKVKPAGFLPQVDRRRHCIICHQQRKLRIKALSLLSSSGDVRMSAGSIAHHVSIRASSLVSVAAHPLGSLQPCQKSPPLSLSLRRQSLSGSTGIVSNVRCLLNASLSSWSNSPRKHLAPARRIPRSGMEQSRPSLLLFFACHANTVTSFLDQLLGFNK